MPLPEAALSGAFTIGGDLRVNRLGFGAMRVTGRGIWGPPADRDDALRVPGACRSSASTSSTPPIATAPKSARS
jgi:hypothetical protein